MELKDIDYKILSYIQRFDEITLKNINKKFSKHKGTVNVRLSVLSQLQEFNSDSPYYGSGYIKQHYTTSKNEAREIVIHPIDTYSITPLGRVTLENHNHSSAKIKRKNFILEFRAWITIIIAVAAFIKSFFF